jgi:hypothetical protein
MSTMDYTCGCSILFNQMQGEHTLIFCTDVIINYCILATHGAFIINYCILATHGAFKTILTTLRCPLSIKTLKHHGSLLPISTTTVDFTKKFCMLLSSNTLFYEPTCTAKTK